MTWALCRCVVPLAIALSGCEVTTHAADWELAPPAPDTRLCAQCPATALRRPPCPSTTEDDAVSETYAYALYAIDFGLPRGLTDGDWTVGADLDCSAGPLWRTCSTRRTDRVLLPKGIDNAFLTQVVVPFVDAGLDLAKAVNATTTTGGGGLILLMRGWNGKPDDAAVDLRLLTAKGASGGASPAWDGNDRFTAYANGWDAPGVPTSSHAAGYVTGGILVWDARALGIVPVHLFTRSGAVRLDIDQVRLVGIVDRGAIYSAHPGGATADLAGFWRGSTTELLTMALAADGCDVAKACAVVTSGALDAGTSYDAPLGAGTVCTQTSIGLGLAFKRIAGVDAIVPTSTIPDTCPGARRCSG